MKHKDKSQLKVAWAALRLQILVLKYCQLIIKERKKKDKRKGEVTKISKKGKKRSKIDLKQRLKKELRD